MNKRDLNAVFAETVRQCRKARAMSAAEFADTVDVGKTTILNIEHGRANPTLSTVQSFAEHLNLSPADMLGAYNPVDRAVSSVTMDCLNFPYGISPDCMDQIAAHFSQMLCLIALDFARRYDKIAGQTGKQSNDKSAG